MPVVPRDKRPAVKVNLRSFCSSVRAGGVFGERGGGDLGTGLSLILVMNSRSRSGDLQRGGGGGGHADEVEELFRP
ncbi:hypothetical protein PBY51_005610 [Eleginops maclovinus]|uniref:Uncharacterized protein n=1 Tax=Eleginops maclovinus TaxID=56733 RepID=A0AAN7X3F3_ELEMC|nr:hypothetical protein PBY51_005610 [Eleginops maclovinus]